MIHWEKKMRLDGLGLTLTCLREGGTLGASLHLDGLRLGGRLDLDGLGALALLEELRLRALLRCEAVRLRLLADFGVELVGATV